MKNIKGFEDREREARSIFCHNGFCYELIPEYGKFPAGFDYTMYSGGYCDTDDNLYLFSRDTDRPIVVLDAEGSYVRDFGKGLFKEVHSLCVTSNNTLLCTDTALHVVRELSMEGELIRDFGNLGVPSDSGYEKDVWRRMMREGKIVATDLAFDKGWSFWMSIQTIKRAAPPFNRPTGVAVGPQGDIFVSDGYGNAAIHRFAPDGTLLKTWGGPGDEPGKFYVPHSIAVDRMNRVWVGDREANSIHVFSADGEVLGYMNENLLQPTALWTDGDYMYAAERGGGLTIMDMEMNVVAQLGFYNSPIRAHGMCGNSKGELFLMPLSTYDRHFLMCLKPIQAEKSAK